MSTSETLLHVIHRDTTCCLCHLVDGSTWSKRRPPWHAGHIFCGSRSIWSPKMGIGAVKQWKGQQVTYQTVVGVRYPELVTYNDTQWKFGKCVQQESPLPDGFLPLFWDVPRANIHAVEDIRAVVDWLLERCDFQPDAKSNLAVLHNRNDMTKLFRASNWISSSNDSIVSRGVTTCAGITAHTVLSTAIGG